MAIFPSWDVSGVTFMRYMFSDADAFDGDISGWDVSGVTSMEYMFNSANAFNGDISGWDVSGVQEMDSMFRGTTSFNQDISSWDVSSVTYMNLMFDGTDSFNQPLDSWDVSNVQDMSAMFREHRLLQPRHILLGRLVRDQHDSKCSTAPTAFNQDISSWDVSSVTSMNEMFDGADSFEQNLGKWYVIPNDTVIARTDVPGVVGSISAQNSYLDGHSTTYGIGTGGDSALFDIVNGNELNMTSVGTESAYTDVPGAVVVTASGSIGTGGVRCLRAATTGADKVRIRGRDGSSVMLDVTVTGQANAVPRAWRHRGKERERAGHALPLPPRRLTATTTP